MLLGGTHQLGKALLIGRVWYVSPACLILQACMGLFKKLFQALKYQSTKIWLMYPMHYFQCMHKIVSVEFKMVICEIPDNILPYIGILIGYGRNI